MGDRDLKEERRLRFTLTVCLLRDDDKERWVSRLVARYFDVSV